MELQKTIVYRAARKIARKLSNSREFARIAKSPDARCQALGRILASSFDRVDEQIEQIRQRLLADEKAITDFGGERTVANACQASKSPKNCVLLGDLAGVLAPAAVVEVGTNLGISSAYIARAIAPHGGVLWTMEGSQDKAEIAKSIHQELDIDNVRYVLGDFADTMDGMLAEVGEVGLAFIDGNHKYEPTVEYYRKFVGHAKRDATLIFDDIAWSDGMKKAWAEISADPVIGAVVTTSQMGCCFLGGQDKQAFHFRGLP